MRAQQPVRGIPHALGERLQQPRLAHPGLAREHDHVPVSLRGALPGIGQECHFAVPPDDRARSRGVRGDESALHGAFAKRSPHGDRLAISLDLMLAAKQVLEEVPRQPMR